MAECPWCHVVSVCPEKVGESGNPCSFRSLPFEKDDIIARIRQEMEVVNSDLVKLKSMNDEDFAEMLAQCVDRVAGVKIMMKVLSDEFSMSHDELSKELSVTGGDVRFADRMALAMKIRKFKRERMGKK
jgi:hypothetical protein